MDVSRESHLNQLSMDRLMISIPPESLHELRQISVEASESGGSYLKGPNGVRKPFQSNIIRDWFFQRIEAQEIKSLRNISKKIFKQSRKELRLWNIKLAERLLERFENMKYLQKIKVATVKSLLACPIDYQDFANTKISIGRVGD